MKKQVFPEATVGALIFNPQGKLFLMKSHKWKGKYVMPGGHIELGEKMEEALIREIKEETGLIIYNIKFICFQEFIFGKGFWKKRHFIFFDYSCQTKFSKVKLNSEAQEHIWVSLGKINEFPIEIYTKKAILSYLKKSA